MNNSEISTGYVGSSVFKEGRLGDRLTLAPNGDSLWYKANTVPTLDLRFADSETLTNQVDSASPVTFTRASIGTYVDDNGVIQSAAVDTPRFDHDPATGESLGLLIEEARTNLLLNSATLSTQSATVTATQHVLSFYGTGTVTLSGASTAGPLVGTGANDRVDLLFTPSAGSLTLTVTGSVTNAQLETGTFPTSYIPTTVSTATRAADVVEITGTNFSSWYNQSAGSVFVEYNKNFTVNWPSYAAFFSVKYSANQPWNNLINYGFTNGNGLSTGVYWSAKLAGAQQLTYAEYQTNTVGTYSHAMAITNNDAAFYQNGVQRGVDTSISLPTADEAVLETVNCRISRIVYWNERLPNATLQTLTT